MEFKQVKVNLKKDFSGFKKIKVAILADSSTQYLAQAIRGLGYDVKLNIEVWEANYDSIDITINEVESGLYDYKPDFIFLFFSTQKLKKEYYKYGANKEFADNKIEYIKSIVKIVSSRITADFFLFNFPDNLDMVFGNYSGNLSVSFNYQLKKINLELMNWAQQDKSISIIDLCGLQAMYGNLNVIDYRLYINSDVIFNLDFTIIVANNCVQVINVYTGGAKKCLILDLDNTIWGGIIGDDGIENIQIGELGIGKIYTEIQLWAKALKERGIVLAVCSKNDEYNAKEPFEKHPDMILQEEDISVFVANWSNKQDNIKYIQSILNIGFDSMVFMDDNPFERNMVRTFLPDVCVPELPEDPAEYLMFLNKLNLFETNSYTEEDKERTKLYRSEIFRNEASRTYSSESEFLQSLNMFSEVSEFGQFSIPRVAQLTQRSNQFNLRTQRYTEEDIRHIKSNNKKYFTFAFTLGDIYGSHGLIGTVILEKRDEQTLFIDTWIMSCRVLKRGMEQFMMNEIVDYAKKNGFDNVIGEYIETKKNGIVKEHYRKMGFIEKNDLWICSVNRYEYMTNYIKKNNEYESR